MRQLGLVCLSLKPSCLCLSTNTKGRRIARLSLSTPILLWLFFPKAINTLCFLLLLSKNRMAINTLAAILGLQIWCLFIACLRKEYSRAPFCVSLSPSLQGSQIWCLFIACLRKEYSRRGRRAAKNRIEQNGHKQAKSKFLFLTVTPRYLIQFL